MFPGSIVGCYVWFLVISKVYISVLVEVTLQARSVIQTLPCMSLSGPVVDGWEVERDSWTDKGGPLTNLSRQGCWGRRRSIHSQAHLQTPGEQWSGIGGPITCSSAPPWPTCQLGHSWVIQAKAWAQGRHTWKRTGEITWLSLWSTLAIVLCVPGHLLRLVQMFNRAPKYSAINSLVTPIF